MPNNLQNDFINLTIAELNQKRAFMLTGMGFSLSLSQPGHYLDYLRTLYHPMINVALEKVESQNTETLTFRDVPARNFLSIVWSVLENSPIPDRLDVNSQDPMEVLLTQNSILFNTNWKKHPADPRFS